MKEAIVFAPTLDIQMRGWDVCRGSRLCHDLLITPDAPPYFQTSTMALFAPSGHWHLFLVMKTGSSIPTPTASPLSGMLPPPPIQQVAKSGFALCVMCGR